MSLEFHCMHGNSGVRSLRLGLVASVLAVLVILAPLGAGAARSAGICPKSVTGCTYAERPFALCEGYHGWLASIAGMKGKTFCVVNEQELDSDTKLHFKKNCTRFTACRALSPSEVLKPGAKTQQKGKDKSPPLPQRVAGPFLKKPTCPSGSIAYQGVRQYSSGPNAGKEVPIWYCFKNTKKS